MSQVAVADDDDPDSFPRPFGQYLLLENFARGGMGEVYLAKIGGIAGLERYCVLKKLRSELTRDREYVSRFIDEARVVVTLNHANICHVFDVGRVGEEYYLAMEYISGRDVRTIQDRCRTRDKVMPPASTLHVVCETLEALDYAHRRNHPLTGEPLNLVHRDVSPQNVLVSYEGEVKLIDFGLAASKLKVERTQPNVGMGKMAFMAPEQARGDPIDARADLFACGVLAYELLAGERFYEGMTANDIWQVAGKGGFIPRRWDTIDRDLQKILSKALHPDHRKRFTSCGDYREALASHLHWRFPGTGVRGLRELLSDLFDDELRREREMLARFGTVTVAGFRTEFEETKSQSITLARADDTSPAAKTALVRNEQSQSAPAGQMPPPNAPAARDVHQDPTRLVSGKLALKTKEQTQVQAKESSTDESGLSGGHPQTPDGSATQVRPDLPPEASRQARPEMTMRVTRVRPSVGTVEDNTALAVDRPSEGGRGKVWLAAAAGVVVIVGALWATQPFTTAPPVAVTPVVDKTPPAVVDKPALAVVDKAPPIESVTPAPFAPIEPIEKSDRTAPNDVVKATTEKDPQPRDREKHRVHKNDSKEKHAEPTPVLEPPMKKDEVRPAALISTKTAMDKCAPCLPCKELFKNYASAPDDDSRKVEAEKIRRFVMDGNCGK